jgi:hypothetical protein
VQSEKVDCEKTVVRVGRDGQRGPHIVQGMERSSQAGRHVDRRKAGRQAQEMKKKRKAWGRPAAQRLFHPANVPAPTQKNDTHRKTSSLVMSFMLFSCSRSRDRDSWFRAMPVSIYRDEKTNVARASVPRCLWPSCITTRWSRLHRWSRRYLGSIERGLAETWLQTERRGEDTCLDYLLDIIHMRDPTSPASPILSRFVHRSVFFFNRPSLCCPHPSSVAMRCGWGR